MHLIPLTTSVLAAALLSACGKPEPTDSKVPATTAAAPASAASSAHAAEGIAWRHALNDADVDASFALARSQNKPVFVYWGAAWCPPCNQLKATLFNRQDFIARSQAFVAVYIDGDSPGAQKLGARFKVRGYPTTVLFNAEGVELTRLPGEVDVAQYTQLLTLGMNAQRSVKAVLADALQPTTARQLSANDWKLLAFYSWESDEQQAVDKAQLREVLNQLEQACPTSEPDTATRLILKSVAVAAAATPQFHSPQLQHRERVMKLLADPVAARSQMDLLTNNAADLVRGLSVPKSTERTALVAGFNTALKALGADITLSRADRLTALGARVELAKIDDDRDAKSVKPVIPEALKAEVRTHVAAADRDITDGYERQAVITSAADVLAQAGLLTESSALLESNLGKSHSPYYLMSGLASNAKKRGDIDAALRWSEAAFTKSEGPATRLQWGASYVKTLVELAPQDEARIERSVQQLFAEAAAQPDAFYERSARSLQRVGTQLQIWNKDKKHVAVVRRLQTQLGEICDRLPAQDAQRAACEAVFKPPVAVGGKPA
jgi:thioredoxin-like negative regulator of GroEL